MKNRPIVEAELMTREGKANLSVQWLMSNKSMAINCAPRGGIPRGAVLVRNLDQRREGEPLFISYDEGLFSALRGQGNHVGNGYRAEKEKVTLTQGSLAWALGATWNLRHTDQEAQQRYAEVMSSVIQNLIRVRNHLKVEAKHRAIQAGSPYDRLGRHNPASRSPLIWTADHLLKRRIVVTRYIRRAIDRRKFQLCVLLDEIWTLISETERHIHYALTKHQQGTFARKRIMGLVDYLDGLTEKLRKVQVAPFGIHTFAHCADDLDQVADDFRTGHDEEAWQGLDKVDRALILMDTERLLEEVMTVISIVMHTDLEVSELDLQTFTSGVQGIVDYLDTPGLDKDFRNPIVADVQKGLMTAIALANDNTGFRAEDVYQSMKSACKCF